MHELSLAEAMIDQIEGILDKQPTTVTGVAQISLEIGAMSGVEKDAFEFVFPIVAKGSRCEGAELIFDEVPLTFKCNGCGQQTETKDPFLVCQNCGDMNVEVLAGRSFRLKTMEVDDGG